MEDVRNQTNRIIGELSFTELIGDKNAYAD
jgi:hypothetical protein